MCSVATAPGVATGHGRQSMPGSGPTVGSTSRSGRSSLIATADSRSVPRPTARPGSDPSALTAPEVIDFGTDGAAEWLVTRALAGRDASAPWPADARDRVVDGLAEVAAGCIRCRSTDCPFDRSLAVTDSGRAARHARHRPGRSRRPRRRTDRDDRSTTWSTQLLAERPISEDLVVCHGDLSIPNVLFDPDTVEFTGLVDVGRVGDRGPARRPRHRDPQPRQRSQSAIPPRRRASDSSSATA